MTTNFTIKNNQGVYFPLFNTRGLRASITPYFGGDLKRDQHRYALEPASELNLYHPHFSRNIIFNVDDRLYFLNGQTEKQLQDHLDVSYEPFTQTVKRSNDLYLITTTSFIPHDGLVEIHHITYKNMSLKQQKLQITTAIPIYGRSADNLRDHRHVTSLLNHIEVIKEGITCKPTLSFDERGHQENHTIYSVLSSSSFLKIKGYLPVLHDFMNGGSLLFPQGLDSLKQQGFTLNGYDAMGGIQYETIELAPQGEVSLIVTIGIHESKDELLKDMKYLNEDVLRQSLIETTQFFKNYQEDLSFKIASEKTVNQLSWVVLQPMLRRFLGNSFLPHHDYGRGGRGWRDLWQDLLALIMMNDESVFDLLYNNFAGIRIDGSNATIIGDKIGEFKADRNMITRIWSDHGAWPLLTTKLFIDETGNIEFLLKKQTYFMDQFTHLTRKTRSYQSSFQTTKEGNVYEGTILEHLLLQNLVGYHNTGKHGFTRLEDADWNDGLDMAHKNGETIAFTHMYAANLKTLKELLSSLKVEEVIIFSELTELFEEKVDLNHFFDRVEDFSGEQVPYHKDLLIAKLEHLYRIKIDHLHKNAFVKDHYKSYFDNEGLDVDINQTINLTGQTMALMNQTASYDQVKKIIKKTKLELFYPEQGGYRLNSDYQKVLMSMGRAYGFAYGHKENGSVFSHMALMYAYGLYKYQFVLDGREAIFALLDKAQDASSHVLCGIPEYFNDRGVGMYPYLTGSASWMILLLRNEVFGIQMKLGKLHLNPKLVKEDFMDGKASIKTYINGKQKTVTYDNPKNLDYGYYRIKNSDENETSIEVYLDEIL